MYRLLFFLAAGIFLTACNKNALVTPVVGDNPAFRSGNFCPLGTSTDIAALPAAVTAAVTANFPDATIDEAVEITIDGVLHYGLDLNNEVHMLVTAEGTVTYSGSEVEGTDLAVADLPAVIQEYITTNFPNLTIAEAENGNEFGTDFIVVELSDDASYIFAPDGTFLCDENDPVMDTEDDDSMGGDDDDNDNDMEDDNDDAEDSDDDEIAAADLPTAVTDWLNNNHAGYQLEEAERDTLCDGTAVITVEFMTADSIELEADFTETGDWLQTAREILTTDLPAAVTTTLQNQYADAIPDEEAEEITTAAGTTQYEVELETATSEIEVLLAADGSVICEEIE